MHKLGFLLLLIALFLVACQPAAQDADLPTLAVLPSETNTPDVSDTPEPTATNTELPTLTNTPSVTPSPTATFTPTAVPSRTRTPIPTETPNSTQALIGTATAAVLEAPRFSTVTPVPPGIIGAIRPTSTGTPEVVADVVINEAQFQEEIDRLLLENDNINRAQIDFVPGGVQVELTALAGELFVTGTIEVSFQLSSNSVNNFVQIQTSNMFEMQSGGEPSVEFMQIASSDGAVLVFDAFNFILNQRLGEGNHNLEFIEITDETIAASLFVPAPSSS